MAGKSRKNNPDNFEKIKKEMTAKRKKANPLTIDSKAKIDVQKQDENPEYPENNKEHNENIDEKKTELVVFRIGEEEYAFGISVVKEIIRIPAMAQIPNAPFYVAGLCSLRGELLPVIDSRRLFGMEDKEQSDSSRIVIVEIQGKRVGLIADRVSEVINIEESIIQEPPGSIKDIDDGAISGILILNNGKRVIMMLDAAKIIKAGIIQDNSDRKGLTEAGAGDLNLKLTEEEQVIIFNVGSEEYTLSIDQVKEIIRIPEMTKVPYTADYIEGVISIRNQLLAVINLGRYLGTTNKNPDEYSRIVIITTGELTYGVIVDKVSQVMRVPRDSFKKASLGINDTGKDYIKGFLNLNHGQRLVILLEAQKLITYQDVMNTINGAGRKESLRDSVQNMDEMHNAVDQFVIFKVEKEEYGIRIKNVKEINRLGEITHFPGSPVYIDGMVNLRGELIPVLNLRTLFDLQTTVTHDSSKFLVVDYNNRTIGIIIDSASEVMEVSMNLIEGVSEAFGDGRKTGYVDSVAKLDGGKRVVLL